MIYEMQLSGLDGSNPLAFLAALGTLRVLELQRPQDGIRMAWDVNGGAWRPTIFSQSQLDAATIVTSLDEYLRTPPQVNLLANIGPDLTVTGERFRCLSESSVAEDHSQNEAKSSCLSSDFIAAFGCDAVTQDGSRDSLIQDTALRTMSGAGHQHFVQFMLEIIASTDASHLARALFATWTYENEGRGKNMRWDPQDDRRYALRWKNPSGDPNTTVRGANRLAIEALPLLTTAPVRGRLATTGFTQRRGEGTRWTWPIWVPRIDIHVCRSLLQLATIQEMPEEHEKQAKWRTSLQRRGIAVLFQSQRITIGKFRSFAPARVLLG